MVEIIEEFPILMEKCQLPQAKEKKTLALQQAKNTVMASIGKRMDEKQMMKKKCQHEGKPQEEDWH